MNGQFHFDKGQQIVGECAVALVEVDLTSDDYVPEGFFRSIYVGGGGDLVLADVRTGKLVTIKGLVAGSIYPFAGRRVVKTGTTATDIIALF